MLARVWISLLAVLGLSGCASFGPTSVDRDRFDYVQAIATSGAVGLRTEGSKESKQEATVLTLGRKDIPAETLADQALVRKLLGLRPGLREFKIVYGALAESDDVIAIQTRSGFQIM